MKLSKMLLGPLLAGAASGPAVTAMAADPPAPSRTIVEYREHMFDPAIRSLANRTIGAMFNTASVPRGARSRPLPGTPGEMRFTYSFAGRTHDADDVVEDTFTDALLIIKNGRVIVEKYYDRATPQTHFNSWSMAKSLNAIMIGFAIKDGKISSVDDPIEKYVGSQAGSGYQGLTIRNLLEMRSGIDWDDNFFNPANGSYKAHHASFVNEQARYTDYARLTKRGWRPDTKFNYNSLDAAMVGLVVARAVGEPVSSYLSRKLWAPAGMEADGFYALDGAPSVGREFTAGAFDAVLRDYGRLGLFMLSGGRIGTRQVLPQGYVARLSTEHSAHADEGLGYGWLWWTVDGTPAFTALGGEGQFIFVDPSTKTVVVKLSHGPIGPGFVPVEAETLAFLKAASRWDGKPSR